MQTFKFTYYVTCWKCRGTGYILQDINKPQLPCFVCGATGKIQKTHTEYSASVIKKDEENNDV